MAKEFDLVPKHVPPVETQLRRIATDFPVPESLPILHKLQDYEPVAMRGQPPVVWDRAEGFQVYDAWGNQWIDWSSRRADRQCGSRPRRDRGRHCQRQAAHGCSPITASPARSARGLVETLARSLPEPLKKIFLLTTGSETVECAIKLCRTYGVRSGGRAKHVIVSFDKAFHGRTLGVAAGRRHSRAERLDRQSGPRLRADAVSRRLSHAPTLPSPASSAALREHQVEPHQVAGVILETYQGGSAAFAPVDYMRSLRQWCTENKALLVCDEVQAGFGRTGTLWGFEHYGLVPDLALFGKGMASSLPIAAVAGRSDVMDLQPVDSMTSTHTGNPSLLRGRAGLYRPDPG